MSRSIHHAAASVDRVVGRFKACGRDAIPYPPGGRAREKN